MISYPVFSPDKATPTKYWFFTGKGGVGKTSLACASAVRLADSGRKVLLISTDPASNLQDVFGKNFDNKGETVSEVPGLTVVNLNPQRAAEEYRESVIAPYRGVLPDAAVKNMEEQLSGSCTVEIASFNEFSKFLTDDEIAKNYDIILFDTAPTGHTLRMLQLPSAWSSFLQTSKHGASCLGQLSGLEDKKAVYRKAVETLADGEKTTLVLVARPDKAPLREAERASGELAELGICHQILVLNGILDQFDDPVSEKLSEKQKNALQQMSENWKKVPIYGVPLRSYNVIGVRRVRELLTTDETYSAEPNPIEAISSRSFSDLVDDLEENRRKVIFTMGKGGVGKTTVAAAVAEELAQRGHRVHLTSTDPAADWSSFAAEENNLTISRIDETIELKKYQEAVLRTARENQLSEDDIHYIEEDLHSPCTQEIAIFRKFAEEVEKAGDAIVVIDTAPTGHALLLLESTENYDREIRRTSGETPEAVRNLLPRLKGEETEVILVALPEATPYFEAHRLEEDLQRAGLHVKWWVMNRSYAKTGSRNAILSAKAFEEIPWIKRVAEESIQHLVVLPWRG